MITIEKLVAIPKEELSETSKSLDATDISRLVEILNVKEDNLRYQAFLLLKNRSTFFNDVYPYWDEFRSKLSSANSYQRSIGLMLISENAKWDQENKIEVTIDDYLSLIHDEKPITIRQCIQGLENIILSKPNVSQRIASELVSLQLATIKETMRKSVLLDILNILLLIQNVQSTDEIKFYVTNALHGTMLDSKSKQQIQARLR